MNDPDVGVIAVLRGGMDESREALVRPLYFWPAPRRGDAVVR